jgi:hypothetical protein
LSGFVKPFDTWADMTHVAPREDWPEAPGSIAYFCNVLADPPEAPADEDEAYPARRCAEVRDNAVRFLQRDISHLWPNAVDREGRFRWELLMAPNGDEALHSNSGASPEQDGASAGELRFDSQYWTANVNPTDRYVLALPGTLKYRISPLDNSYDNLTITGDWTDCGFNEGCVEAAVMSGRLAAHAISDTPALEDIIGYDHP